MNEQKVTRLLKLLAELGSTGVAFSGGADSSYLLAVALDALGRDNVLALTADSPLTPRTELAQACEVAAQLGARHMVLRTDELSNPQIASNPPDRCYYCKLDRFQALLGVCRDEGISHLVHGENADDASDYRPGSRAAIELGVLAPLRQVGMTKSEIRLHSRDRGLPNWDKPANACLASRFPYGTLLTVDGLARVEAAEEALHQAWGPGQLRVRDHFPVARVEAPPELIPQLAEPTHRSLAVRALRQVGYRYVSLDLVGYRMGSLNDEIEPTS
jgi:uncharacterized protein